MKCFVFVEYRVQASVSTAEHQIGIFLKIKEVREKKKNTELSVKRVEYCAFLVPQQQQKKEVCPFTTTIDKAKKKDTQTTQ